MSEHIKTGAELYNIGKYKPEMMIKDGLQFAMSKWVSLSWLKEQIEKKCYDDTVMPKFTEPERWIRVSTLLSLLEENKP